MCSQGHIPHAASAETQPAQVSTQGFAKQSEISVNNEMKSSRCLCVSLLDLVLCLRAAAGTHVSARKHTRTAAATTSWTKRTIMVATVLSLSHKQISECLGQATPAPTHTQSCACNINPRGCAVSCSAHGGARSAASVRESGPRACAMGSRTAAPSRALGAAPAPVAAVFTKTLVVPSSGRRIAADGASQRAGRCEGRSQLGCRSSTPSSMKRSSRKEGSRPGGECRSAAPFGGSSSAACGWSR